MRRPFFARTVGGQRWTWLALASEEDLRLVVADLHPAPGSVDVHPLRLARTAEPVAQIAVDLRAVGVLIRGELRVGRHLIGRFAGLVETADAVRRARMLLLAEQPADRIERMHGGVSEIAGTVFPEPVPVTREVVRLDGARGRGPEPQIVVDAGRYRTVLRDANRIARAVDHGLARVQFSETAVTQELHGFRENAAAAALRSGLDDAVVAACGVDHQPPFDIVVADRLLDVDILAGLARPDRHQRVPVIGCGNRDGIDIAVVEHATEIRFRLRIAAVPGFQLHERTAEMPLVDVHHVRDANVRDAGKMVVVILTPAASRPRRMVLVVAPNADDRDVDCLVGTLRAASRRERQRESGGCGGSFRKEDATVHDDPLTGRLVTQLLPAETTAEIESISPERRKHAASLRLRVRPCWRDCRSRPERGAMDPLSDSRPA